MISSSHIVAGTMTAFALFFFFMLMDLMHLSHIWELRFFNAVILFFGIRFAIVASKKINSSYLTGFFSGIRTTIISVLLFLLLFVVYTTLVNPQFFEAIEMKRLSPFAVDKFLIIPALFFEGICSGVILTFIAMQYYKSSRMISE